MIKSKSIYVSYLRCNWLPHYRAIYNLKSQDTVFSTLGQIVDKLARDKMCEDLFDLIDEAEDHKIKEVMDEAYKQFPGAAMGVEYDENFTWEAGTERTKNLIADKSKKVILQACFVRGDWGCIVDILIRLSNGNWLALEVKSFLITNACSKLLQGVNGSIADSGTWLDDIAFQYWIVSATINVKFRLQCVNAKYEFGNGEKYFATEIVEHPRWLDGYFTSNKFDIDRAIREKLETLDLHLVALASDEKTHKCGSVSSCKKCDFVEICRGPKTGQDAWAGWLPNATDLRDKKMSECVKGDITKHQPFLQWRQLRADRENSEIREPFRLLTNNYPINPSDRLIDFEAVIHPFPHWFKQTPWQPISFMFSWGMPYFESGWEDNGKPMIVLSQDSKNDPRPYLVDALVKLECPGRLLHWGAFDRVIMEKLIAYEQDQARKEKLVILLHKMVDGCAITKNTISFPNVRGYSIKQVGPYCSGISYTDDTNGMQVGIDWLAGKDSEAIEYCRLDNIQEGCALRKAFGIGENRSYVGMPSETKTRPSKWGDPKSVDSADSLELSAIGLSEHKKKKNNKSKRPIVAYTNGVWSDRIEHWTAGWKVVKSNKSNGCIYLSVADAITAFSEDKKPKYQYSLETKIKLMAAWTKVFGGHYNYPHRQDIALDFFRRITGKPWPSRRLDDRPGKEFDAVNYIGQPLRSNAEIAEFKSGIIKGGDCKFEYDKQAHDTDICKKRREETLDYDYHCFAPLHKHNEMPIVFIIIPKCDMIVSILKSKQDEIVARTKLNSIAGKGVGHDAISISLSEIFYFFGDSNMQIYVFSDDYLTHQRITKSTFQEQHPELKIQF